MFRVARRVQAIEYAIRDVLVFAKKLEAAGKKIFYLNIGDPVKFDFGVPNHIKQALKDAVEEGANYYSSFEGLADLREAICEKEKSFNGVEISPENVLITQGISEGIQMVTASIIENGGELLVPGPAYPPYTSYAKFFEGESISYKTSEDNYWQPDIDDLRSKITSKTRGIVIINPNNPTGAFFHEKNVKQIVDLAGEHNLPLISDEIYDAIVYEDKFVSTSSIARDVPVVGLNGFSKTYLMTGWRLGYMYFYDNNDKLKELKKCVEKQARIRLCANTPVQKAGVAALKGPQGHITEMVNKLRERRDYSCKRLNEIAGISFIKPEGSFYIFPRVEEVGFRWKTDKEFARQLLKETGILVVHGSGFDPIYGSKHFRAVILPPIETLEKVFALLEKFMLKG
jgi:alanine-synthesizing transaminase